MDTKNESGTQPGAEALGAINHYLILAEAFCVAERNLDELLAESAAIRLRVIERAIDAAKRIFGDAVCTNDVKRETINDVELIAHDEQLRLARDERNRCSIAVNAAALRARLAVAIIEQQASPLGWHLHTAEAFDVGLGNREAVHATV